MIIKIHPAKAKFLLIIIIFLFLVNILGLLSKYLFGHNNVYGLVPLFNFDTESNVPTWYSSVALFMCSLLLGIIAYQKKIEMDRYRSYWIALSLIFLYLSIDEASQIHEESMKLIGLFPQLNSGGIFYFSWTIIGIPLVSIFILFYIKFLINLPAKTRFLFLISGVLYVGGALGMELIDGWYASINGKQNLMYAMMTTLEETLEMLGVALFFYSLLSYIHLYVNEITINISEEDNSSHIK